MQSTRTSPFLHPPTLPRPIPFTTVPQPSVPMEPMETIEPVVGVVQTPLPQQDTNVFSYEWNIFEQSLEWAHQDSLDWVSESVLSTSPSSLAESHFSPVSHSQSHEPSSSPTFSPKFPLPNQPASKQSRPRRHQQSPESRARRRSQNREAQRAFRCRKQQHIDEMEIELRTMVSKYEGLQEKYENLGKLYMNLLK